MTTKELKILGLFAIALAVCVFIFSQHLAIQNLNEAINTQKKIISEQKTMIDAQKIYINVKENLSQTNPSRQP